MQTLSYPKAQEMPTPRKAEETPLQATYRRAAEEGDSWTWTPKVEGCLDVLLVRTHSHEENPELPPYEVTVTSCTCPIGERGKLCKHLKRYRDDWAPDARMAQLEAAGGPSAPAPCRRCLSTGKIGPRHFCSCSVGQSLVQSSVRRRRVVVA